MLGNSDRDNALVAFAEKLVSQGQPPATTTIQEKVQVDTQQVPSDGQTVEPESTIAQSTPEAVDVTKEQEKPQDAPVEEPEFSWDAATPEDNTTTDTSVLPGSIFDIKKIGGALGFDDVKDESDFISKVSAVKNRVKELEEAPLIGINEELREVLEVAKRGEDYKEYLLQQVTDFSKVDPIKLYEDALEADFRVKPEFIKDGQFDLQKFYDYLDTIPDDAKTHAGKQLASMYNTKQKQKQAEIKARAEEKVRQADKTLSTATQKLSEILPQEKYGVKFEPKHSATLYKGITDSSLTKKHLGGVTYEKLVEAGADMNLVARTIMLAENADKMIGYSKKTAESVAKRSLLAKVQNADLSNNGSIANPNAAQKQTTVTELMKNWKEDQAKSLFGGR